MNASVACAIRIRETRGDGDGERKQAAPLLPACDLAVTWKTGVTNNFQKEVKDQLKAALHLFSLS